MTPLISALKRLVEEAEGRVAHMYQCSRGHVTVGVGHLIPSAHDAALLDLVPVTEAVEDWHRVKLAPAGLRASAYAEYCRSRMSDAAIDALLDKDVWQRVRALRARLPYDGYPEPVQLAVFDMAYNLGLAGFEKYEKLRAALDRGDWLAAADECHRRGISEARNARTAAWFREAAGVPA
jgi:GH24 family phage-related lysozyme (muramidase)